ncbi:ATP-binding protein [Brucella intermedia]|uniref:ATP-binding protein n=1 Tax=Brucella intermedia TaxID=94625 RepID=UPI002248C7B2|nr:ATP-binding protein [Brucella intermedia]
MRFPFPRSLPSWLLTILISGLLITQIATLWIVSQDRKEANYALELFRLSERATSLVKLLNTTPVSDWNSLASRLASSGQGLTITAQPDVPTVLASEEDLAELEDVLVARLARYGVIDARIRRDKLAHGPHATVVPTADSGDIGDVEKQINDLAATANLGASLTTSLQFGDGRWINFTTRITPADPIITTETIPLFALVALSVVLVAIWATRRLTAPYRVLEHAVHRIGGDLKSSPLPEDGSREYKAAARAVNTMQSKLLDYVAEREQLAAALAHDLRTPLTRIRLRLALVEDEALAKSLAKDLSDIEAISRSVIDFATSELANEEKEKVDLWSLLLSIADNYPDATLDERNSDMLDAIAYCQPVSVQRSITNLIDNAIAYGGKAKLSLRQENNELVLRVKDNGPGIPADQIEEMFKPFNRVEKSRNRDSGGFGLGLTIARNVARANAGDILLKNNPSGGLIAELHLPVWRA